MVRLQVPDLIEDHGYHVLIICPKQYCAHCTQEEALPLNLASSFDLPKQIFILKDINDTFNLEFYVQMIVILEQLNQMKELQESLQLRKIAFGE